MTIPNPDPSEELPDLKEGIDYYVDRDGYMTDIKEKDPRYKHIIETVRDEVSRDVEKKFGKGRMGNCHVIWSTMKEMLKKRHNIDWHDPGELNSDIIFD